MKVNFFVVMKVPTKTHQQKQVSCRNGKPVFYEPAEVKKVRAAFKNRLSVYAEGIEFTGPLRLVVKFMFHKDNIQTCKWKTTRPDTDNMIKMLKDVMTDLGFWKDDAQVASEHVEKFWTPDHEGVYIEVENLE